MESLLSQVLKDICTEYEIEEEIISPVLKKLNSEFYFKLKDMKNLSYDLWISFKLPLNLYNIINEKYQEAQNQQKQTQVAQPQFIKQEKPQQNVTSNKPKEQPKQQQQKDQIWQSQVINRDAHLTLEKISSQVPPSRIEPVSSSLSSISSDNIQTYLAILAVEIDSTSVLREVLLLITNSLSNIKANPTEEKYKKLNLSTIISKYPYQSINNFLEQCLFKALDNKYILFKGEMKDLAIILSEIALFLKSRNIILEEVDLNKKPNQIVEAPKEDFDRLYQEEIKRRSDLVQKHTLQREPKLLYLTSEFTLNTVIMQMNQEEVIEYQSDENKMIIDKAINIIKANANDRFTMKSRASYEKLIKTPILLQSHIRLVFPDEKIIEAWFSIRETIGNIVAFIKEYLMNPSNEFTLSTTPPLKKYIKMNQSIQELKLYPKVMVNVNFASEYDKLNDALFIQSENVQKSFNSNFTFNPNSNHGLLSDETN